MTIQTKAAMTLQTTLYLSISFPLHSKTDLVQSNRSPSFLLACAKLCWKFFSTQSLFGENLFKNAARFCILPFDKDVAC